MNVNFLSEFHMESNAFNGVYIIGQFFGKITVVLENS